ncbi:MAG: hypothetical protein ACREXS_04570 [Gammaproteobacteria bacterium]
MTEHPIDSVLARLTDAKSDGRGGYVARCPAHEDKNPSLSLSEGRDGNALLKCFAGCEFRDVVHALGLKESDFFAKSNGKINRHYSTRKNGRAAERGIDSRVPILSVPPDAPAPPRTHLNLGRPVGTWTYRNADGFIAFYVYRFKLSNGDKIYVPLTFCRNFWEWRGGPNSRPLYTLSALGERPDAPLLVCEGEKAAAAAAKLFPDVVVTTSANGAASPQQTNWTPLAGREAWLWPDNDDAGREYAEAVVGLIKPHAKVIKVLAVPGGHAEGWDAADALKEGWLPEQGRYELVELELGPEAKAEPLTSTNETEHIEAFDADALRGTEHTNAELFVSRLGGRIRFCALWSKWLVFDGTRWVRDETLEIERLARDLVHWLYEQVVAAPTEDGRKRWGAVAHKLEGRRATTAMLAGARALVPVRPEELDRDAWALNCLNGTLDLRTGELRPHRREDNTTRRIEIEFDAKARAPTWEKFLEEVFAGDAGLTGLCEDRLGTRLQVVRTNR